jgi:hypothetical protein
MPYSDTLDGNIFNRSPGASIARMDFITNDIAKGAADTITNSELHRLVANRKYTVGLSGSLELPNGVDPTEIPGYNDDFPTLIKDIDRTRDAALDTINRRRVFRIQNNGRALRTIISWMNRDLTEEALTALKALAEESSQRDLPSGTRYSLEKEVAATEGYVLQDLIATKWDFRDHISDMQLDKFIPIVPEIYTMSYHEYVKVTSSLGLPNEQRMLAFRDLLFAAIRIDIIAHVNRLRLKQFGKNVLTKDFLESVQLFKPGFEFPLESMYFINMVTRIFNALSKVTIDPNVESINKLYEARQMEYIKKSMSLRQKDKTGFELAGGLPTMPEEEHEDHDEDPDGDGDGQRDKQETHEDDYVDDGYDNEEELVNMIQGETED